MKRTVGIMAFGMFVIVFFTGCSSLAGSMKVEAEAVGTSVAQEEDAARTEEETGDGNGARLNYTDEDKNKDTPDYYEQNQEQRLSELTGTQAFEIKEGHSQEVSDFQIGGLKGDNTFIYGYASSLESSPDTLVHCGVFYNYKSKAFQVFHENTYQSSQIGEDQESFYMQVCVSSDGETGDIFVYDNGVGYLYDHSGSLKVQVDLETFVRRQYPDVYSLSITKAMTDGDMRIYLDISIEKEMLDIEVDENADEEESEEELDEQAEQLEQEIEAKVEEVILVYELKAMSSDMTQDNLNFDSQKQAWIDMTDGEEYEEEPDADEDWDAAEEAYPDLWGGVTLPAYENLPLYQWKGDEKFLYESAGGVCTFVAYPDTYTLFTDLRDNAPLGWVFYAPGGHYSRIYGSSGARKEYNPETITRTYTYVWYEEKTDENGETREVQHTEERKQTIERNKSRKAPMENAYMESFWNLRQVKTLGNSIGSDIIATGEDGQVCWIRRGGTLESTGIVLDEAYRVGAIPDGNQVCLVSSDASFLYLISSDIQKVDYQSLGGGYESGDSAYDQAFEEKNQEDFSDSVDVYSGGDYFTEENVLRADMTVDTSLLDVLRTQDPAGDWPKQGGVWNGYLFTTRNRGLVCYNPKTGESMVLAEGSWYRSFSRGGGILSVGFASSDSSYSGLDVAHARVYEYDLDSLCRNRMTQALSQLEKQKKERDAAAAESESAALEEAKKQLEGVKNPLKQWGLEFKRQ